MFKYFQKTGKLQQFQQVPTFGAIPETKSWRWVDLGVGYSGHDAGLNNPTLEAAPDLGPIPCGLWSISLPYDDPHRGNPTFRLTPLTYRGPRNGFLIHADNAKDDHSASCGCVVLSQSLRQTIASSKGDYLLVEAE